MKLTQMMLLLELLLLMLHRFMPLFSPWFKHVPQQKPPTFQVHVCFGAKEAYEEAKWPNEDIDPYNIPDYGDAFISHMVYTDFESFPRVVATEEETNDQDKTSGID